MMEDFRQLNLNFSIRCTTDSTSKKKKKSEGTFIGFRATPNLKFELENICKELKTDKTDLMKKMLEEFINEYYRQIEKN